MAATGADVLIRGTSKLTFHKGIEGLVVATGARRSLLALVAPLLAASLVACGGAGGGSLSAEEKVAEAAEQTRAAGSLRWSFAITFLNPEQPQSGERPSVTGQGLLHMASEVGRATIDLSAVGRLVGEDDFGEAEVISTRRYLYMRFPYLTRQEPELKQWIRFEVAGPGDKAVKISGVGHWNPPVAMRYLDAAASTAEPVGEEAVRGVSTDRYRLNVELAKLARHVPNDERARIRGFAELGRRAGIRQARVEAWIDGEGRVRRLTAAFDDPEAKAAGETVTLVDFAMELYDFGVEVDVKPPKISQVTRFEDVDERGSG